jgi:hypothetical protein
VFEKEHSSAENSVNQYIKSVREELDLDKLIAKEEYELESINDSHIEVPKSDVEKVYEDFLTSRGRK